MPTSLQLHLTFCCALFIAALPVCEAVRSRRTHNPFEARDLATWMLTQCPESHNVTEDSMESQLKRLQAALRRLDNLGEAPKDGLHKMLVDLAEFRGDKSRRLDPRLIQKEVEQLAGAPLVKSDLSTMDAMREKYALATKAAQTAWQSGLKSIGRDDGRMSHDEIEDFYQRVFVSLLPLRTHWLGGQQPVEKVGEFLVFAMQACNEHKLDSENNETRPPFISSFVNAGYTLLMHHCMKLNDAEDCQKAYNIQASTSTLSALMSAASAVQLLGEDFPKTGVVSCVMNPPDVVGAISKKTATEDDDPDSSLWTHFP